jgi:hypothetical protein
MNACLNFSAPVATGSSASICAVFPLPAGRISTLIVMRPNGIPSAVTVTLPITLPKRYPAEISTPHATFSVFLCQCISWIGSTIRRPGRLSEYVSRIAGNTLTPSDWTPRRAASSSNSPARFFGLFMRVRECLDHEVAFLRNPPRTKYCFHPIAFSGWRGRTWRHRRSRPPKSLRACIKTYEVLTRR